jgi:hypothetical protein
VNNGEELEERSYFRNDIYKGISNCGKEFYPRKSGGRSNKRHIGQASVFGLDAGQGEARENESLLCFDAFLPETNSFFRWKINHDKSVCSSLCCVLNRLFFSVGQ